MANFGGSCQATQNAKLFSTLLGKKGRETVFCTEMTACL